MASEEWSGGMLYVREIIGCVCFSTYNNVSIYYGHGYVTSLHKPSLRSLSVPPLALTIPKCLLPTVNSRQVLTATRLPAHHLHRLLHIIHRSCPM